MTQDSHYYNPVLVIELLSHGLELLLVILTFSQECMAGSYPNQTPPPPVTPQQETTTSSPQSVTSQSSPSRSSCGLWNAARCKQTDVSNIFDVRMSANKAVDGNRNPLIHDGYSCVHTRTQSAYNWWMVDLNNEYLVHKLVITNRGDSQLYAQRFWSVDIDLFISDPRLQSEFPRNTNGILCTRVETFFEGTKSFACATPAYARYVKLMKTVWQYFHFCEVEVMVSTKRDISGCTVSKGYQVKHNFILEDDGGLVLQTTTCRGLLYCIEACQSWGVECTACQWTEGTKSCQLLVVDPFGYGPLVEQIGTNLYVEAGCDP